MNLNVGGIGEGTTATAVGSGLLEVNGHILPLTKLYYVPGMPYTLVSVRELHKHGYTAEFGAAATVRLRGTEVLSTPIASDGLYRLSGVARRSAGAIF